MAPRRWLLTPVLLCMAACQAPTTSTLTAPVVATPTPQTAPVVATPTPQTAPVARTPSPAAATPSAVASPTASAAPSAPPATASRVETLNAANAAFQAGKLNDAAGLYERVANTPASAAESQAAAQAITDFAHFRGIVTLLADGREDDARTQLEALRQRGPSAPLARLADQLYNQYGMVGQVRGACAQLQPQIATQAGPALAGLQALGVTSVDAANLCSPPGA